MKRRNSLKTSAGLLAVSSVPTIPGGTGHLEVGENLLETILMQAVNSNDSQNCHIWSPRKELQPVCRRYAGQDNFPNLSIETNNNSGCHGGWEI